MVCSKWVPRLLTTVMRTDRGACSNDLLAMVEAEPEFYNRLVTGNESWVHHCNPETQAEAKEWRHRGSPRSCRQRTKSLAGKIMLTVLGRPGAHCVLLLVDIFEHKHTITRAYYASLLKKLRHAVKKRHRKRRRGCFCSTTMLQCTTLTLHKMRECGFRDLNHPPYSPDLAPNGSCSFLA